jgi:hypothetical protein
MIYSVSRSLYLAVAWIRAISISLKTPSSKTLPKNISKPFKLTAIVYVKIILKWSMEYCINFILNFPNKRKKYGWIFVLFTKYLLHVSAIPAPRSGRLYHFSKSSAYYNAIFCLYVCRGQLGVLQNWKTVINLKKIVQNHLNLQKLCMST